MPTLPSIEQFAPVITASIAVIAAVVGLVSISVQKAIARKRAAIDFFLRTEMDSSMVTAYAQTEQAIKALKQAVNIDEFAETSHYSAIRAYLNIHELMAVGIRKKVLDDGVCYHYWSAVLARHCRDAEPVIQHAVRSDSATYTDLRELNLRWQKQLAKWYAAHPPKTT